MTIAGFVCLLKKGMMRSMVLMGTKKRSSKMEGLGTRAARGTRTEKDRKRTDNLNTAMSCKTAKDRPRGKKTALVGEEREGMLDAGLCMDMEIDDQPVLSSELLCDG